MPQIQVAYDTHGYTDLFATIHTVSNKHIMSNFDFYMNSESLSDELNDICETLYDLEQSIKELTNTRSVVRENAVERLMMVEKENLPHRHDRLVLSLVATDKWQYRDAAVTKAARKVEKIEAQLREAKAELKGAQSVAQTNHKARVISTAYSCRMSGAK